MTIAGVDVRVTIHTKKGTIIPEVVTPIIYTTERFGRPGRAELNIYNNTKERISHGDIIKLYINEFPLFYGYIFGIEYSSSEKHMCVVAYDQMRYLFNDCSFVFESKSISEVFEAVCSDLNLTSGYCDDTALSLHSGNAPLVYRSVPAIDILKDCIDIVLQEEGRLLVLFDDFGKLTIKDIAEMKYGKLLEPKNTELITTSTNIDESTYNRIRLKYGDGSETSLDGVYVINSKDQSDFGVLAKTIPLTDDIEADEENLKKFGKNMLKLHESPVRNLKLNGVLGDPTLRAGMYVPVSFDLDVHVVAMNYCVKSITHKIDKGYHTMDISLEGVDVL